MKTFLFAFILASSAQSQIITTVAGDSTWGGIRDMAVDSAGSMYVVDGVWNQVYKVDRLGVTTTIAGVRLGSQRFGGDGGPATAANLFQPSSVAVAADGTVYIADSGNGRIRKIDTNGIITTYAGNENGSRANGIPATGALLIGPAFLALDPQGNLYFVDYYLIRKITTSGIIMTVAGTGKPSLSPEGMPATATDISPGPITVTSDGTIYYSDGGFFGGFENYARIRKIAPNGIVSNVAGTGARGFTGDGGPAKSAQLAVVGGIAVDPSGNVYISDSGNFRVRKVGVDGIIRTYAGTGLPGGQSIGDGGPAVNAALLPISLALDSGNNLYVLDISLRIRKITPPPVPTISFTNAVVPSFIGKADFASNMYVELYGSNLSTTSRSWAGGDFRGSNAPTTLDGVSVTVNGKPAFIYYISPGQININTPEDTTTGPVLIQVRNALGLSNTGSANRSRLSPALQTVAQFLIGGKQYVVAQTPDFKSFIGRPNMLAGVPFVVAKPGDTVLIYALGCGPTNPATQAGVVASQNSPLALPFEVRIGGIVATVTFGGMVANSIGLYQFNVSIPNVQSGDQTIELIVDGVPNNQNLMIVIG